MTAITKKTYRSLSMTRTAAEDDVARGPLARLMQEPPLSAREAAGFRKSVAA